MKEEKKMRPPRTAEPKVSQPTASDDKPAAKRFGDFQNALAFCEDHRNRVLYDHSMQSWRFWDGKRWQLDVRRRHRELAKQTLRRLATEADSSSGRKLQRLENVAGLRAMLEAAETLKELSVEATEFDTDPLLLNCANGVLHLDTGELLPHDPARRISKLAPVDYAEMADSPLFDELLNTMYGGDVEVIEYVLEIFSYCLTGLNHEKAFFLLHGPGDTGKTTLMKVIMDVLGDYAVTADITTFMPNNSGGASHRTDMVALVGARLVSASEGDRGFRLSEGSVKKVTGTGPISVRELYGKPMTFEPVFKLVIDTNHLPQFSGNDQALWNRLHLIQCRYPVPKERQRPNLRDELRFERSGILRQLIGGWQRFRAKGGLVVPADLMACREEYREREDTLGQFLEEECELDSGARTSKGVFVYAYQNWAERHGEQRVSSKALSQMMVERGFGEHRSNRERFWIGVALRHAETVSASSADA